MEEEILKIYDNLYNVIGVAPRSEVHKKGLLHQVVHLWMMEVKNGEKWLYFRQRSMHRKDFPGLYDLISSGHIDPEETFEDAIIENTANKLGVVLTRDDIRHIGNIRQVVDKGDYHDNAFCQIYFCQVSNPEFHLHYVENVVKMQLRRLPLLAAGPDRPGAAVQGRRHAAVQHLQERLVAPGERIPGRSQPLY